VDFCIVKTHQPDSCFPWVSSEELVPERLIGLNMVLSSHIYYKKIINGLDEPYAFLIFQPPEHEIKTVIPLVRVGKLLSSMCCLDMVFCKSVKKRDIVPCIE
jgi:hypothetical protein